MKYNYNTSLTELRTSLRYRSREFLLENNLHGVPYFVDSTRPKWERITWFILTLASTIAIVAIIVIIWRKFQTEPTITGLDIMTQNINIDFPQVFVCFEWELLNHSHLHKNEMHVHEHLYKWQWGDNVDFEAFGAVYQDKNTFHSTFTSMVPECNDIIRDCTYKGIQMPCEKLFTKVLASVGACCKLKTVQPLKLKDVSWNLEFRTIRSNILWGLYFTQNGDFSPKPDERTAVRTNFPITVQFIVDITYNTPDIRRLTLHQRGCQYKQGTSLNNCEISCLIDQILSRCNCVPWFLSLTDKAECPLSKYSCLKETVIKPEKCDCWLPCDHVSHSVKSIVKSDDDINRIMLRRWPTAVCKREMRFGYLDLLVSFGGIAGLFLGYSLLVSVEFGYYFSLRTYCGAVITSSRKKCNIVTVHVVEKLPDKVDSNPRYYQYLD